MVMLFAAEPRRLMTGYLLGAYTASISIGLVIVFALEGKDAVKTTQHTFSPAADVVLGALCLLIAFVVRRPKRAAAKGPKRAPAWRRALDQGSPRARTSWASS
jgi:hypothetical protein